MPSLNIVELLIDAKTHTYARIYSSLIEDEYQRKRSYASIVALYALSDVIEKSNSNVQKSMTLFKHPKLNEEFEISDFYVNNWHIDVRVLVDGDAVLLPKKHFDNNILPDFYAIVKVDKALNNASLLGFIEPKTVNKQVLDYHYYSATLDSLISYGEFLEKIQEQKKLDFSEEEHQKFKEKYLTLLDEELDVETKSSIIRHIFACPMCRTEFCCFTGFEMVSCNMGQYPELMEDQMLNVIGATDAYDSKYEGKEQLIPITDEAEQELLSMGNNSSNNEDKNESQKEEIKEVETIETTVDEFTYDEDDLSTLDGEHEELQHDENGLVSLEDNDDHKDIVEYEAPTQIVEEDYAIIEKTPEVYDYQNDDDFKIDIPALPLAEAPKEETVSDILDELFNSDDDFEDEEVSEKSVNIEPQQEDLSNEVDSLEEDYQVDSQNDHNDEYKDDFVDDVQTLEEDEEKSVDVDEDIENLSLINIEEGIINETPSGEIEYIDEHRTQYHNSDLEIYEDEESVYDNKNKDSEIETIEDDYEDIDIQNVIVDYDEMGNPIYSYITDIPETQVSEPIEAYQEDNNQTELQVYSDEPVYNEIENDNEEKEIPSYQETPVLNEQQELDDYDILDEQYQSYSAIKNLENEYAIVEPESYTNDVVEDVSMSTSIQDDYIETPVYTEEEDVSIDEVEEPQEEYIDEETAENYPSEFNDENYVDETDESIPEEKISNGNPIIAVIVLLAILAASAFGGYKLYQSFANQKADKVGSVIGNEDIASVLDTDEMLAKPAQSNEEVEENIAKENSENVDLTDSVSQEEDNTSSDISNLPKLPNVELSDDVKPLTERDLLSVKENSKIINNSMASAFSANTSPAMVKNINWLCTPQLFTDTAFKAFLQEVDGLLKLNMRKNILNATESPKNRSVSVKMAIDNAGKIEKIMMAESSGSEQIDNIVLQSINESLTGKKSPKLSDGKLKADRYHLKVVIKL